MAEVTVEKSEPEVIHWADLNETKREIIDVFERSPDPILWTSEIVDKVSASRPTVLKHLNELRKMGIVDNKENVDTVWWLEEDAVIIAGARSGVFATVNRWFPTSVQSLVHRWMNRLALFGGGLALFGMFTIIVAFYLLANDVQPPEIGGLSLFAIGLFSGLFGFLFMLVKVGTFIGDAIGARMDAYLR